MARNIIAIIIGLFVAFLATYFVYNINSSLFPLPENIDPSDMDAMKAYMASLPIGAFIIVIIAHIAGSFAGALTASKIGHSHHVNLSLFIGVFMLLMGIIRVLVAPHPIWFIVIDIMVYLPSAYLGYIVFKKYWSEY